MCVTMGRAELKFFIEYLQSFDGWSELRNDLTHVGGGSGGEVGWLSDPATMNHAQP